MNELQNLFASEIKKLSIHVSFNAIAKLYCFIDLLLDANKTINLTAITDYQEALFKHLYDSLMILNCPAYSNAQRIIDIGSGAGFPGIPLAICFPEKQFVSLDSVQKKVKFQEQACRTLGIDNIRPIWARAEDFIQKDNEREKFELAIARAVAPLNILAEIALPFIKIGGHAVFYKGKDYQNELHTAERAITAVGGEVSDIIIGELPMEYGLRSLINIKKVRFTPLQYPRKAGIPQKKPL